MVLEVFNTISDKISEIRMGLRSFALDMAFESSVNNDAENHKKWTTFASFLHTSKDDEVEELHRTNHLDHIIKRAYAFHPFDFDTPENIRSSLKETLKDAGSNYSDERIEELFQRIEDLPQGKLASWIPSYLSNLTSSELDEAKMKHKSEEAIRLTSDSIHEELMDNWDKLNDAVGGDLFSNQLKLDAMRRVDMLNGNDPDVLYIPSPEEINSSWGVFQEAVVSEMLKEGLIDAAPPEETESLVDATPEETDDYKQDDGYYYELSLFDEELARSKKDKDLGYGFER